MEKKLQKRKKIGLVKVLKIKYPFYLFFSSNNFIQNEVNLYWVNSCVLKILLLKEKGGLEIYKGNFGVFQLYFLKTLTELKHFFQKFSMVQNKFIFFSNFVYKYVLESSIVSQFLNFLSMSTLVICNFFLSVNLIFSDFSFLKRI